MAITLASKDRGRTQTGAARPAIQVLRRLRASRRGIRIFRAVGIQPCSNTYSTVVAAIDQVVRIVPVMVATIAASFGNLHCESVGKIPPEPGSPAVSATSLAAGDHLEHARFPASQPRVLDHSRIWLQPRAQERRHPVHQLVLPDETLEVSCCSRYCSRMGRGPLKLLCPLLRSPRAFSSRLYLLRSFLKETCHERASLLHHPAPPASLCLGCSSFPPLPPIQIQ